LATDQQNQWTLGEEAHPLPLKVKDPEKFIKLCILRGEMEAQGSQDVKAWRRLANEFEQATGREENALTAWCERQIKLIKE
jgi:hypothetical protein